MLQASTALSPRRSCTPPRSQTASWRGFAQSSLDHEPESDDDGRSESADDMHPDAPVIYPRMRFSGHCNVETVKDGERYRKASTYAQWGHHLSQRRRIRRRGPNSSL